MLPGDKTNGWRSGHDPFVRILRIATVVVLLAVIVYLVVKPNRQFDDISIIFGALGVALILLGYEGVIRLPWFANGKKGDD